MLSWLLALLERLEAWGVIWEIYRIQILSAQVIIILWHSVSSEKARQIYTEFLLLIHTYGERDE